MLHPRTSLPLVLLTVAAAAAIWNLGTEPSTTSAEEPTAAAASDLGSRGRRPIEVAVSEPPVAMPTAELAPQLEFPLADARMWRVEDFERSTWYEGEAVFLREWDSASGLGAPDFNASSCATCHKDPVVGGAGGLEFNVLVSTLSGYYEGNRSGRFSFANARAQRDQVLARGKKVEEGAFVEIQTPTILGIGAIARIPDAEILRREDPKDRDGNGIRGVARRIRVQGREEIGRFGWKASVPRVEDFVHRALGGEHGLTVEEDERGFGLPRDWDGAQDPEVPATLVAPLVQFVSHLAPPAPGPDQGPSISLGSTYFESIGCADCHVPSLMDDQGQPVPLYSDLLLHDIGTEKESSLAKRFRFSSVPRGLRTPPLWGVGSTAPYLSDGRAETLEAAILAHEGEAEAARAAYEELLEADRERLLAFLSNL